jgi:hypothetical protein
VVKWGQRLHNYGFVHLRACKVNVQAEVWYDPTFILIILGTDIMVFWLLTPGCAYFIVKVLYSISVENSNHKEVPSGFPLTLLFHIILSALV